MTRRSLSMFALMVALLGGQIDPRAVYWSSGEGHHYLEVIRNTNLALCSVGATSTVDDLDSMSRGDQVEAAFEFYFFNGLMQSYLSDYNDEDLGCAIQLGQEFYENGLVRAVEDDVNLALEEEGLDIQY